MMGAAILIWARHGASPCAFEKSRLAGRAGGPHGENLLPRKNHWRQIWQSVASCNSGEAAEAGNTNCDSATAE